MSDGRRGLDTTAIVLIGVAVALIAAYWAAVALSEEYYFVESPPGSTFNAEPEGTQILYNYLKRLDIDVRTLQRFDELPEGGTIVIVANRPFEKDAVNSDVRRIREWVEAGGNLVMIGPFASELPRGSLGGSTTRGAESTTLEPLVPSVYAQGVARVEVDEPRILIEDPTWVAHIKDLDGQVLLSRTFGRGSVAWLAGIYPASNEGIAEQDNARLVTLLVAQQQPVYFDEYHHGFVSGGGVWERLGGNGQAAALLGIVALAVMLVAGSRRLASPIEPLPERRVRGGSYIASLAELYRKSGARPEALGSLEEGLRRAVLHRWGGVDAAAAHGSEAAEVLARSAELRSRDTISAEEFTNMAREIARARQEVERRHG